MENKKVKFGVEQYHKPTPKKWRQLGDALLSVSTVVTTYAIADDWAKWAQISALVLGVVGTFLTRFFAESNGEESAQ